ncbi:hypothetical protein [Bradyrhizobium canariense]|uniref:Uncharacterized protein n=1 Tax=Bradyrhizobium canariense TaxID=255045 RepID=A0A1H2BBR1_9BRAD|nr:hypothetical protein [Bradyrhizobium canariense]SDT55236.1 hypothetical protein SAMN05444158_6968 [Bradyrhizobium canariense]
MVAKNVLGALIGAALLAWSGQSIADEYRPGEFLGLDLSKAVLSPKRLGPETQFAPVRVEANSSNSIAQAPARPKVASHVTVSKTRTAHLRPEKPRGSARTKLVRRHSNPLDAEAFDTRIQVWPCKTGGICDWQRQ